MPSPSPAKPSLSRGQIAELRLTEALGFRPETGADEWLEAVADVVVANPKFAQALSEAYRARDTVGWSRS